MQPKHVLKETLLSNIQSFGFKTLSVLMYVWISNWRQSFLCKKTRDKYESDH